MRKVYVVPHTHWDKEWYFSTKDSNVLSDQIFKKVIKSLENDENLKFCMDGQSSIVDEFLQLNPEYKERIMNLSEKGQIELGPWYTQTDCLYVDGETILRNLCYGIYCTNAVGNHMKIAYLPDTFGFNSQMPLISNHVGINNLIFRRDGVYGEGKLNDSLFKWKTKDGSFVNTVHLVKAYSLGLNLSDDEEYITDFLEPNVNELFELTKSHSVLCPAGNDQTNLDSNLTKIVNNLNKKSSFQYEVSTYSKYFKDNEENFNDEYVGELRVPNFHRVHLTIGSIRADIKLANWNLEQKLLKKVEPLLVLAKEFDIDISTKLLYEAWKRIFDSAAHDAMGGCVTDSVHNDIMHRYKEADEILDGIENTITNMLAQKLGLSDSQVIIFNLTNKAFQGIKEIEYFAENKTTILEEAISNSIIDVVTYSAKEHKAINNDDLYYLIKSQVKVSLPAFGFKIFNLKNDTVKEPETIDEISLKDLKLYIKKNKLVANIKGHVIEEFISFVDIGNDGDTYDFSPVRNDEEIKSYLKDYEFIKYNKTMKLNLTYELMLPYDLENRRGKNYTTKQTVMVTILIFNDQRLRVEIKFDNKVLSHRLSLVINTGNKVQDFKISVPYGIKDAVYENRKEKLDENYLEYWVENFVFDQFANFKIDSHNYMTLVSHGSKELTFANSKIMIPLITTTGDFGKPDLLYRPGRASGDTTLKGHIMMFTENAQLLGENNFCFDVYFSNGEIDHKLLWDINDNASKDTFYQWQLYNKFHYRLDSKIQVCETKCFDFTQFQGIAIEGNVQVKTTTPSLYNKDDYLVRIYNPFDIDETFNFDIDVNYEVVNAIEEKLDNQELVVKANSIMTVKIKR